MDSKTEFKYEVIDALADKDPVYQDQLCQMAALEKQFDKVVGNLPDQDRGLIWDYVMLCEDMSQRKQQLACKYMELPAIAPRQLDLSDTDWKAEAEKAALEILKNTINSTL